MAASDHLSEQLFHGTTAKLKPGEIINPTKQIINDKTEAYATTNYNEAHIYARSRATNRDLAKGHVYEVEPLEGDETLSKRSSITDKRKKPVRASEKGFRVKSHVTHVKPFKK
jgi:hypothetical protein